jgi:hypothetical protein|tara:strand:+ start:270 stop:467 length:198 start_codon:yes stop_codon:yes gene_type:complete
MGWEENQKKRMQERDMAYADAYERMNRRIKRGRMIDLLKRIMVMAPVALAVGAGAGYLVYYLINL